MRERKRDMRIFRFIMCFVLGVCLFPDVVSGQFTETKEIHKQFKVAPETQIEISNKYGKIELNTWDKDSVIFDIKIRVEEKKLSKLEKAMDAIDFEFNESQYFLIARTTVGQNKSELEKEILKFKETVFQSGSNITIDYTVWLPATNELKVENKFGDIFIGDFDGDAEINLSNGNLKSHNFTGKLDLTLSFADATINTIESANLDCIFSELYIKKAEKLIVKSKSTKFEILEINELDADSRRDNFRIRLIERIEANGSFSNFRINELTDRLHLRMDYGDLDIDKTAVDFSSVFIESKSTDINLYFDEQSDFGFNITHTKTELDFCKEIEIKDEKSLDEKEKKMELLGNFGGKSENETKLTIKANSGELNIRSN